MIIRNYSNGQLLDVAGLNKIRVLLDRSETNYTEIGYNEWRPGLIGPPHKHDHKDQIFYITSGNGTVRVDEEEYKVQKGCLVYVPEGIVHQTINIEDEPLSYLLLNIFNDNTREGHRTFEEHIERVKHIRKVQADSQNSSDLLKSTNTRFPKFIKNINIIKAFDFGSYQERQLIDQSKTKGVELFEIVWSKLSKGSLDAHSGMEQSFFVLEGNAQIGTADGTHTIRPGDLVYMPGNTPYYFQTNHSCLRYLSLNIYR